MSERFNRYLFEYRHEGASWALELQARDPDDAIARLKAMPWAKLKGEVAFSASVRENWFTDLLTKLIRPRR